MKNKSSARLNKKKILTQIHKKSINSWKLGQRRKVLNRNEWIEIGTLVKRVDSELARRIGKLLVVVEVTNKQTDYEELSTYYMDKEVFIK